MNKEYEIRTGVIGVGSMGKNHVRIYSEISNLVAIADPDEEQGKLIAEKFGVEWFRDYESLLPHVDAVTISVPTVYHKEVARKCTEQGVHILVEKPLADNVKNAESIINYALANKVTLGVGHVERFNAVVETARRNIKDGNWGEIFTITARRFSNYPSRIHDVGVLFDLTIHDVDVICHLISDKAISVYALGGKSKNDFHEDHVSLLINFEQGQIGLCETNWLTPMKVRDLSLTTDKCYINLDYLEQNINVFSSNYGKIDNSNLYKPPMEVKKNTISPESKEPLRCELEDFLSSIIQKKSPFVTGQDGLRAVKIVEAGLKSLNTGKVINL
ncbi:MAG: Gfo/Idh/MocA family oxidoreductase [Candidatus Poseidoniales archaeon]